MIPLVISFDRAERRIREALADPWVRLFLCIAAADLVAAIGCGIVLELLPDPYYDVGRGEEVLDADTGTPPLDPCADTDPLLGGPC